MQVGIFFYTNRRFGWGMRENFTLAAAQGLVYVVGALFAHGLTARVRPAQAARGGVRRHHAQSRCRSCCSTRPRALVAALLAYTALMAVSWPILESLVSTGLDAHALSRRISMYNVVWAGTGAATLAVNGAIIDFWPGGIFLHHRPRARHLRLMILLDGRAQTRRCAARANPRTTSARWARAPRRTRARAAPRPHARPVALADLHARELRADLRAGRPAPVAAADEGDPDLGGDAGGQHVARVALADVRRAGPERLVAHAPARLLAAAWLMLAGFAAIGWQPAAGAAGQALAVNLAWLVAVPGRSSGSPSG